MATRLPFSSEQYWNACKRNAFKGAFMFTFKAGTTGGDANKKVTFTTSDESVQHTNPIQADANGIFPEIYGNGAFFIEIQNNALDEIIIQADDIQGQGILSITAFGSLTGTTDGALQATGQVGDFVETFEYNENTDVGSGKYEIVNVDPGFPLINPAKTDGSGFFLKLLTDQYSPTISGAIPGATTDVTEGVQQWIDWMASVGNKDLSLGGSFTVDAIQLNSDHDGCTLSGGELVSIPVRSLSNSPIVDYFDLTSTDIDYIGFSDLRLIGQAVYTGDRPADAAANAITKQDGNGLRVIGKSTARVKLVAIDNVHCESVGNSGVSVNSVDDAQVGRISGQFIFFHAFSAEIDGQGFGAISTWPLDFTPKVTVDQIHAISCGTIFDFSTVGASKTDDSGTYRPLGYINVAKGTDISHRTKIHGNWDFEAGTVSAVNSSFAIQDGLEGTFGVVSVANDVIKRVKIGLLYGERFPAVLTSEANGTGLIEIDKVHAKTCLSAIQRLRDQSKISMLFCEDTYAPITHTDVACEALYFGNIVVINSDRQFFIDNIPAGWAQPGETPIIFSGGVKRIYIDTMYTENVGTSIVSSQYTAFITLLQNQELNINKLSSDIAATIKPFNFILSNSDDTIIKLGRVTEIVSIVDFQYIKLAVAGAFSNYLFCEEMNLSSTLQDEFDGTLTQSGPGLFTWTNALDYRGKATLPVLKTDGASLGTIGA